MWIARSRRFLATFPAKRVERESRTLWPNRHSSTAVVAAAFRDGSASKPSTQSARAADSRRGAFNRRESGSSSLRGGEQASASASVVAAAAEYFSEPASRDADYQYIDNRQGGEEERVIYVEPNQNIDPIKQWMDKLLYGRQVRLGKEECDFDLRAATFSLFAIAIDMKTINTADSKTAFRFH